MSEQKYREFWIAKREADAGYFPVNAYNSLIHNWQKPEFIHVIEDSAFQAAQDKIQQLEKKNEIYRKALEFYANKKNWDDRWRESDDGNDDNSGDIFDVINIGDVEIVTEKSKDYDETFIGHYTHGGERARQALKDAESIE